MDPIEKVKAWSGTPGGKTSTHTNWSINQLSKLHEIVTVSHNGAWIKEIELSYKTKYNFKDWTQLNKKHLQSRM